MQRVPDGVEHPVALGEEFGVPDTQHSVALRFEPVLTHNVALVLGVLAAVQFDDQVGAGAVEVDDVVAHRYLATELDVDEGAVAEDTP